MGARFVARSRGEREANGGKEQVGLWHGMEGVGQGEVAGSGMEGLEAGRMFRCRSHGASLPAVSESVVVEQFNF
jgi:hypothetical protein